jgi:poly-gamma-glutamate capsule biosynthesis protein CapA/YwtB (metallophosphatase superfamily)
VSEAPPRTRDLRIALTGDSIVMRRLTVFKDEATVRLLRLLREADVAFTNLEVLPNDFRGHPAARSDGAHLAAGSWIVDELLDMGFDLFSLATNHALDYGVEGLRATFDALASKGAVHAGAGETLTAASLPAYTEREGGTVALVACASTFFPEQAAGDGRPELQGRPGVNPLRYRTVYEVAEPRLAELRAIAEELGLERKRREFVQLGFASDPNDPAIVPLVDTNLRAAGLLNAEFRSAPRPGVRTTPDDQDTARILRWVREARARADLVIVSLHAHEEGEGVEQPAEFVRAFAHRAVEEGADVVVGHGPHLLRGMELHRGRPIFYSLGNFIGQNELVERLPADSYARFGADPSSTPSEVFRLRNNGGRRGFPADERYWQTVVPVCSFAGGELTAIELLPVALGRGKSAHHRGRPVAASGETATRILSRFAELSRPFGVSLRADGGSSLVELGSTAGVMHRGS